MMTRMISGLLSVPVWTAWFAVRYAKYAIDRFIGLIYSLALSLHDALHRPVDTSN